MIKSTSIAHEKLATAKDSLSKIQGALRTLIDLHENCRILLFSDQIAHQVDDTFAMNAFERCRLAVFEAELVRLCALWDRPERKIVLPFERSLPTVASLLNDDDVIELIRMEHEEHEERLGMRTWRGPQSLKNYIARTSKFSSSEILRAVTNYRNKYLAHNLTKTKLERGHAEPMALPRYKDVTRVLLTTIAIANEFTVGVTGSNFVWSMQRDNSKRCAEALWSGCKMTPLE